MLALKIYVAKDAVDQAQDLSLSINVTRSQGVSGPRGCCHKIITAPTCTHVSIGVSLCLYH